MCVHRCRRAMMAIHFDEVWNDEECNQMCDVCRHGNGKTFLTYLNVLVHLPLLGEFSLSTSSHFNRSPTYN